MQTGRRMVQQSIEETGERWGVVSRVARQLGIGEQTLRNWVERADIDAGRRPGVTTEDKERIAELEKENRELRRANAILKSASAFFAAKSTARSRSPLHRRSQRGVRGRADLQGPAGRPLHLLWRQSQTALGPSTLR